MHPELFTVPFIDYTVKSYGAMLTLGFLTGAWLAMCRAERVKADPDVVINMAFVCLICGVLGARVFYVAHYWESTFAKQPNPWLAALDCTGGGLEYYGGLICAILGTSIYVAIKKVSVRMYLDIMAPSAAWGLAFGRMGCLLNGCCWGGLGVDAQGHQTVPWAVTFPFSSNAQIRQWEERQITVPAELIFADPHAYVEPYLVWMGNVEMPVEKREGPAKVVRNLTQQLDDLKTLQADPAQITRLETELAAARKKLSTHEIRLSPLRAAQAFPSCADPTRSTTVSELEALIKQHRSLPVHPAQMYDIINALLLSWMLAEFFHRRKRHGLVFAALCLVYPLTRVVLETIRVDNPHDTGGLTISQAVSVGMFLFGAVLLLYLYRLPLRSPRAVAYIPPQPVQSSS